MKVTLSRKPKSLKAELYEESAKQVALASGSLVVNFRDERQPVVVPLDELGNLVIVEDGPTGELGIDTGCLA